jgi:xylulokinase
MGIAPEKYPDLVKCTDVLGPVLEDFAKTVGLGKDVQVVAGSIDYTAAAVGSGAVNDYAAHLYIGTSSWLAAHVPFKKTDVISTIASVPCARPGRYLMMAQQSTAGGNLDYLREKLVYQKGEFQTEGELPSMYDTVEKVAAKAPPGSNGVLYMPWIYGERAPVEDQHARAALFNLSLENSRADVLRAVLEGIALNTRWLVKPVERFLGHPLETINIIGGGASSDLWCQIFADVLERPMRQVKNPIQANVRGAAFIAAVGLDYIAFDEIEAYISFQAEYAPQPENKECYDRLFREFVNFYKATKAIYHRLNEYE